MEEGDLSIYSRASLKHSGRPERTVTASLTPVSTPQPYRLGQWSPAFWAPGTNFMEDNYPPTRVVGGGMVSG